MIQIVKYRVDFTEEQEERLVYPYFNICIDIVTFPSGTIKEKNSREIMGKIFFSLHLWSFLFFNTLKCIHERFLSKIREKYIYIYIQNFMKYHFLPNYVYILIKYIQISGSGCVDGKRFGYTNNRKQRHINLPRADR